VHSANHWANEETMREYVREVLVPYYKAQKVRLGLPLDYPCVWLIDCWSVHIKDSFIAWVQSQYPFIRILFIPANCTGLMQPCDLAGQRDLKCILRSIGTLFAMVQMREALKRLEGLSEEERQQKIEEGALKIDTSISVVKPLLPGWLLEAQKELIRRRALLKGWEVSRLLEALHPVTGPLNYKLAVEKLENGSLWLNTRPGTGGVAIPATLERVTVAKKAVDAAGQEVVQCEEEELPEPKESEADIAADKEMRDQDAALAEEVRRTRACQRVWSLTCVWGLVEWMCRRPLTHEHRSRGCSASWWPPWSAEIGRQRRRWSGS